MTEIFNSQNTEQLLVEYIQARQEGDTVLSDEVWMKLLETDRKNTNELLKTLRDELNNTLQNGTISN
ncbi:hypothetical protein M0R04_12620 [Candidatus Dojkabacteria bacterium]|jgi:hypothetical protein|nr:hypothetical protein [Candidatus Dojkabacteria bacterium]